MKIDVTAAWATLLAFAVATATAGAALHPEVDDCRFYSVSECENSREMNVLESLQDQGVAGARTAILVTLGQDSLHNGDVRSAVEDTYNRLQPSTSKCTIEALQTGISHEIFNADLAKIDLASSASEILNFADASQVVDSANGELNSSVSPVVNALRFCTSQGSDFSIQDSAITAQKHRAICTSARIASSGQNSDCISAVSYGVEAPFLSEPRSTYRKPVIEATEEPTPKKESQKLNSRPKKAPSTKAPKPEKVESDPRLVKKPAEESPSKPPVATVPEYAENPREIPSVEDNEYYDSPPPDYYEPDASPKPLAPKPTPKPQPTKAPGLTGSTPPKEPAPVAPSSSVEPLTSSEVSRTSQAES